MSKTSLKISMAKGRGGKGPAGERKVSNAKKTKPVDDSEEESCGLCCEAVKDDEDESLIFCEGPCGQWFHRYCAGVTTTQFEQLSNSEEPFFCYACFQRAYRAKVASLEDKITSLIAELEELKGAHRDREAQSSVHAKNKLQWSQVVKRGKKEPHAHPPPPITVTAAQQHSTSGNRSTHAQGGTTNRSSRPSRRAKQGVVVKGARRVWRTHDSTTTRAVRKAITDRPNIHICGSVEDQKEV